MRSASCTTQHRRLNYVGTKRHGGHVMNVILLRALLALVPTCLAVSGSVLLLYKRTAVSFLQLIGAGCLVIVPLTHLAEPLHLLLWMHWGLDDRFGPYLDLSSAVLGLTFFPTGDLLHALA